MRYDAGLAAKLRRMTVPHKLVLTLLAAVAALCLMVGPALAEVEDPAAPGGGEDHRISLAETPRDRLGLILLGVLFAGGGIAVVNARRQMKGERDQATGEFRWR